MMILSLFFHLCFCWSLIRRRSKPRVRNTMAAHRNCEKFPWIESWQLKLTFEHQEWRWREDDFPFQINHWNRFHVNFRGCSWSLSIIFSQAWGVDFFGRQSLRGHDRNSKFMLDFTRLASVVIVLKSLRSFVEIYRNFNVLWDAMFYYFLASISYQKHMVFYRNFQLQTVFFQTPSIPQSCFQQVDPRWYSTPMSS